MHPPAPSRLKGVTILIVDDDFVSNLLLREYLAPYGMELLSARDAGECLRLFEAHGRIALVLMDVRLGSACGLSLAERLKGARPQVRVIAQTALTSDEDRLRLDRSACDAYLLKPIRERELVDTLERLLG